METWTYYDGDHVDVLATHEVQEAAFDMDETGENKSWEVGKNVSLGDFWNFDVLATGDQKPFDLT